jgi:hypothetical protein
MKKVKAAINAVAPGLGAKQAIITQARAVMAAAPKPVGSNNVQEPTTPESSNKRESLRPEADNIPPHLRADSSNAGNSGLKDMKQGAEFTSGPVRPVDGDDGTDSHSGDGDDSEDEESDPDPLLSASIVVKPRHAKSVANTGEPSAPEQSSKRDRYLLPNPQHPRRMVDWQQVLDAAEATRKERGLASDDDDTDGDYYDHNLRKTDQSSANVLDDKLCKRRKGGIEVAGEAPVVESVFTDEVRDFFSFPHLFENFQANLQSFF